MRRIAAKLVSRGEQFGRTLSIAWPLWRDGGDEGRCGDQFASIGRPACDRWRRQAGCRRFIRRWPRRRPGSVVLSGELSRLRGRHVEQARTSPPPAAGRPRMAAAGAGSGSGCAVREDIAPPEGAFGRTDAAEGGADRCRGGAGKLRHRFGDDHASSTHRLREGVWRAVEDAVLSSIRRFRRWRSIWQRSMEACAAPMGR